jgi:hypothetical protein
MEGFCRAKARSTTEICKMQWRGALALRHSLMSVVLRMISVSIIGMSMVTAVA